MNKLKPILDFLLFSNIFVAFAFACLTFQTFYILNSGVDNSLILFVFSSSVIIYSFHRSFGLIKISKNIELPLHLEWIRNHKKQMVLIFMFTLPLIIFCSFKFSLTHALALIPMGLISIGYTIPVIPGSGRNIALREVPGLKIFLIAFVTGSVTVFLPVISLHNIIAVPDTETILIFLERFLFVFTIAIPFDIRDMANDKTRHTKTIPVMLGEKKSKLIAYFALGLCTLLSLFHYYSGGIGINTMISMQLSFVITAILIFYSSKTRNEYYFSFGLDGMMVVQTALMIIFNF